MDIDVLFEVWLADIDSVPFAHDPTLNELVGDLLEGANR